MDYLGRQHEASPSFGYDNVDQVDEDIPRSTSAPPHLEELQNAYLPHAGDSAFPTSHEDEVSVKPFADIRLDEDYEEFYKNYSGAKKLPPPVENRMLYVASPTAGTMFHSPFSQGFEPDISFNPHSSHHGHNSDGGEYEQHISDRNRQFMDEMDHRNPESNLSASFARMNFGDSSQGRMLKMSSSFTASNGSHADSKSPIPRSTSSNARIGSPEQQYEFSGFHPPDERYRPMLPHESNRYEDSVMLEKSTSEPFGPSHRSQRRHSLAYGMPGRSLSVGSSAGLLEPHMEMDGGSPLDGYGGGRSPLSPPNAYRGSPVLTPTEYEVVALKQAQQAHQLAALQLHRQQKQQQEQMAQLEEDRLRSQLQQQQMMMMMMMQGQDPRVMRPYGPAPPPSAAAGLPRGVRQIGVPPGANGRHARAGSLNMDRAWTPPQVPMTGVCPYFLQGYCSKGDSCPFMHSIPPMAALQQGPPVPAPRRENGYVSPEHLNWSQVVYDAPPAGIGYSSPPAAIPVPVNRRKSASGGGKPVSSSLSDDVQLSGSKESPPRSESPLTAAQIFQYNSLDDVEGKILAVAKDQHGCRFLQRKFDEGGPVEVVKIFNEIRGHVVDLMTDPFGNYLIQKLLEVCSGEQRVDILKQVTESSDLITISLNMHGTRAVQKLIETLEGPEQTRLVIENLRHGVVALIKDLNGNHVIQRCLQKLSNEDSQFIFDAAAQHCIEIATHRHGCCVLQRCIDFASGTQRNRLVKEIANNSLVLGQDPFGNYVVQYILDLKIDWAALEVIERLEGQYVVLAQQKFSSNVVEKCIKLAGEDSLKRIVTEIITSPRLSQLLQDPFANYVFQSALSQTKGALHTALVEAIKPHSQLLKSSPYGKRILSRINARSK